MIADGKRASPEEEEVDGEGATWGAEVGEAVTDETVTLMRRLARGEEADSVATVNIRRDFEDKFYRYKMPLLQLKVEGLGDEVKTVVSNMEDIARALNRPPSYSTKFFGIELGTQITMANDRYIINGQHTAERLRELLDAFIDMIFLCPSCASPQTELVITDKSGHEDVHRERVGRGPLYDG